MFDFGTAASTQLGKPVRRSCPTPPALDGWSASLQSSFLFLNAGGSLALIRAIPAPIWVASGAKTTASAPGWRWRLRHGNPAEAGLVPRTPPGPSAERAGFKLERIQEIEAEVPARCHRLHHSRGGDRGSARALVPLRPDFQRCRGHSAGPADHPGSVIIAEDCNAWRKC